MTKARVAFGFGAALGPAAPPPPPLVDFFEFDGAGWEDLEAADLGPVGAGVAAEEGPDVDADGVDGRADCEAVN